VIHERSANHRNRYPRSLGRVHYQLFHLHASDGRMGAGMTYDEWKTTDPTELGPELSECDCCGELRVLSRCWPFGIETYACDECQGAAT
jgi:hypothetical protein